MVDLATSTIFHEIAAVLQFNNKKMFSYFCLQQISFYFLLDFLMFNRCCFSSLDRRGGPNQSSVRGSRDSRGSRTVHSPLRTAMGDSPLRTTMGGLQGGLGGSMNQGIANRKANSRSHSKSKRYFSCF